MPTISTWTNIQEGQHAYLDRIYGYRPILNDTEMVTRVLTLANEVSSFEEIADALSFCTNLSHGSPRSPERFKQATAPVGFKKFIHQSWERGKEDREWFRDALSSIIDNREPELRVLSKELNDLLTHILVVPKLSWTGKALRREDKLHSTDVKGAIAYVLMLLIDNERGLTKALKQCRLSVCGRFFLSRSSGGRPPLYCCRDHQTINAAQSGAIRTERWRKKQSEKRGKKS